MVDSSTADTHAAILDAAVEIMATEGIAAVTFRAIATRVGVTPMALYHHIADKDALLSEVIERGYRIFADYLACGASSNPDNQLERTIEGFRDFAFDHGHYFELMFLSTQLVPGLVDGPSRRAVVAPTYATLRQRVADRMGVDPENDRVASAARSLLITAVGAIALHRTSLFTSTRAEGVEQFDIQMRTAIGAALQRP